MGIIKKNPFWGDWISAPPTRSKEELIGVQVPEEKLPESNVEASKLEKLQDEEQVEKPFIRKQMKIRFPERGRSGRSVVTIKGLEFGFENEVLFNNANLTIERGEKIVILGPNGCGKSTFLKLIMGMEKPDSGEVLLGDHNVLPNYFEQNQAEALDLDKTVLEIVAEVAEDWRLDDIKGLLGRYNCTLSPKCIRLLSMLSNVMN